jgi:energy-coupling factor transporter ATP-binding protein EcfA2
LHIVTYGRATCSKEIENVSIKSILVERRAYESLGIGYPELPLDEPLNMPGLGQVVLLAGPNGGGKSRLLRMLPKLVTSHLNPEDRKNKLKEQADLEEDIRTWRNRLQELRAAASGATAGDLQSAQDALVQNQRTLETLLNRIQMTEVVEVSPGHPPSVVEFVPQVASLVSPAEAPDKDVDDRAGRMTHPGSHDAHANAPAYLRGVLRAATLAQGNRLPAADAEKALQRERALLDLMKLLLGAKVVPGLSTSLNLRIEGVDLPLESLSPGQQVLFQFACMLHAQGASLANCVVVMDEPENHLHPKVMLEVVDRIVSSLGAGQLWIATHSVPLVAHLASRDASCLWLVEDGKVKSAKRAPADVLYSLMGGPDATGRLREFLRLPEHYATLRFLAQCLEPPGVVGADIKDPQTNQIRTIVRRRAEGLSRSLRLLDFGAGKARLLRTLAEGPDDPKAWLDYYAFDIDTANERERREELIRVYGDVGRRSLDSRAIHAAAIDDASVDIVVLCNVLHEIDPDEWRSYFGEKGLLTRVLHPDGHLLIVEDYGIPIGERAHKYGFLLLDEQELVTLFGIKSDDLDNQRFVRSTPDDPRFKDRLVAHLVGSNCLQRFTPATQKAAIEKLEARMAASLKGMLQAQQAGQGAQVGPNYARTAQLLANATLWVDDHR